MIDQQLKKKIVNTISQYEHKCDQLQTEINVLRSAINQLSILPAGIHVEIDKQLLNLQEDLHENRDSQSIQQRVDLLVEAMSGLQQKKQENKTLIKDFIKQGTVLLSKMTVSLSIA